MASIILKKTRERSLLQHHPWIFSGAVDKADGITDNGQTVEIRSNGGEMIATGSWSQSSQISARVWSFDIQQKINDHFIKSLVRESIEARYQNNDSARTNACRLINAESDGLPGFIVDRYADFLVCQFLSAGSEYWRSTLIEALIEFLNPKGIYERSDSDSRLKEGFEKKTGILHGMDIPETVTIMENGIQFLVNVRSGHKTGFYLDQRENRSIIQPYCKDKEILNCFSYTGGFGIAALAAGAKQVVNIDSSAESLRMVENNLQINGLDQSKSVQIEGDVFHLLRSFRDSRKTFDLIILDPPKFTESKSRTDSALRGYKDINLLAMKLLNPGGYLFTFSCSGHIVPELFLKVVSEAAADSRRRVQMIRTLLQAEDHPVVLNFPESLYLKGLVCRVW